MPAVDEDFILTFMKEDLAFLGHPQFHHLFDVTDWVDDTTTPGVT